MSSADEDCLALIPAISTALRRDETVVAESIGAGVLDALPLLGGTESLRSSFDASLTGNLHAVLTVLDGDADGSRVPLADAQVDFAHQFVEHSRDGLPLILGAYRLGQSAFLNAWTQSATEVVRDAQTLASVVHHTSRKLDDYISRASAHVATELGNRSAGGPSYDAAQVHAALAGRLPPTAHIQDYPLAGRHLALLARMPASDTAGLESHLASFRHALAAPFSATQSMGLVVDDELWLWLRDCGNVSRRDGSALMRDLLPPGARLAFGRPLEGAAGFARSHRQARRALASPWSTDDRVRWYDDVEFEVLMSADPELAADFVAHELGALGGDDEASVRLRSTLRIYLEEQGSARRTAERLFLHRNSVTYRIRRAEQLLNRGVMDRPLTLHAALRLAEAAPNALDGLVNGD